MVNPEVEAGRTTTKSRNEEDGGRIHITKRMVSEFGATLETGQPHTEESRARITSRMENDPAHAKRPRGKPDKAIGVRQTRALGCHAE